MNEMRWGFSTSEAYFTILAVLVVLTAIGTFIGQWLSSKSTTDLAINRNRIINSRIRAAWGLIFVFAVAVYLGQALWSLFLPLPLSFPCASLSP